MHQTVFEIIKGTRILGWPKALIIKSGIDIAPGKVAKNNKRSPLDKRTPLPLLEWNVNTNVLYRLIIFRKYLLFTIYYQNIWLIFQRISTVKYVQVLFKFFDQMETKVPPPLRNHSKLHIFAPKMGDSVMNLFVIYFSR